MKHRNFKDGMSMSNTCPTLALIRQGYRIYILLVLLVFRIGQASDTWGTDVSISCFYVQNITSLETKITCNPSLKYTCITLQVWNKNSLQFLLLQIFLVSGIPSSGKKKSKIDIKPCSHLFSMQNVKMNSYYLDMIKYEYIYNAINQVVIIFMYRYIISCIYQSMSPTHVRVLIFMTNVVLVCHVVLYLCHVHYLSFLGQN